MVGQGYWLPPSPAHLSPMSPHRGLPADVVHSHGHILHHVETLTSHCDGPAAAVGTAHPVSPPAAQRVRPARGTRVWVLPDRAAAGTDGHDDRVPHVPKGEVATHTAPALKAHTHGHRGWQRAPRHSAGDAGVCAPVGGQQAPSAGLLPPTTCPCPTPRPHHPEAQACAPGLGLRVFQLAPTWSSAPLYTNMSEFPLPHFAHTVLPTWNTILSPL